MSLYKATQVKHLVQHLTRKCSNNNSQSYNDSLSTATLTHKEIIARLRSVLSWSRYKVYLYSPFHANSSNSPPSVQRGFRESCWIIFQLQVSGGPHLQQKQVHLPSTPFTILKTGRRSSPPHSKHSVPLYLPPQLAFPSPIHQPQSYLVWESRNP